MNYLTNYYKNLCEQLQHKINILEAQIHSPAERFHKRGYSAELERTWQLRALEGSLKYDELSPEDRESLTRVVADIRDPYSAVPGSPQVRQAEAENRASKEKYKGVYGTTFPEEGNADVRDLRTAIKVLKSKKKK